MITKKYGVFNPLEGVYTFLSSKEDATAEMVKIALNFYYVQCNGCHFYIANFDENGHETSGENVKNMTEIPQEILDAAIKNINETL